jgi:hypothetical protein
LVGKNYQNVVFKEEELMEPIVRDQLDKRKGIVWTELDLSTKLIKKKTKKKKDTNKFISQSLKKYLMISNLFIKKKKSDSFIKTIIINEKYLKKEKEIYNTELDDLEFLYEETNSKLTESEITSFKDEIKSKTRSIVQDIIIIDSPGFNDDLVGDINKFKTNVDVLEFFIEQSSMVYIFID